MSFNNEISLILFSKQQNYQTKLNVSNIWFAFPLLLHLATAYKCSGADDKGLSDPDTIGLSDTWRFQLLLHLVVIVNRFQYPPIKFINKNGWYCIVFIPRLKKGSPTNGVCLAYWNLGRSFITLSWDQRYWTSAVVAVSGVTPHKCTGCALIGTIYLSPGCVHLFRPLFLARTY